MLKFTYDCCYNTIDYYDYYYNSDYDSDNTIEDEKEYNSKKKFLYDVYISEMNDTVYKHIQDILQDFDIEIEKIPEKKVINNYKYYLDDVEQKQLDVIEEYLEKEMGYESKDFHIDFYKYKLEPSCIFYE